MKEERVGAVVATLRDYLVVNAEASAQVLFDVLVDHYEDGGQRIQNVVHRLEATGITEDVAEQLNKLDCRVRDLQADNDRLLNEARHLEEVRSDLHEAINSRESERLRLRESLCSFYTVLLPLESANTVNHEEAMSTLMAILSAKEDLRMQANLWKSAVYEGLDLDLNAEVGPGEARDRMQALRSQNQELTETVENLRTVLAQTRGRLGKKAAEVTALEENLAKKSARAEQPAAVEGNDFPSEPESPVSAPASTCAIPDPEPAAEPEPTPSFRDESGSGSVVAPTAPRRRSSSSAPAPAKSAPKQAPLMPWTAPYTADDAVEVIRLLASGCTPSQAASQLGIPYEHASRVRTSYQILTERLRGLRGKPAFEEKLETLRQRFRARQKATPLSAGLEEDEKEEVAA